jgi:outer membrane protease
MPPKEKDKLEVTYGGSAGTYKIEDWVPSDGFQYGGGTVDSVDVQGTYDMGQISFDFEEDLRKKYPALQDAHEHYQNIKQMCETREKEEDAS